MSSLVKPLVRIMPRTLPAKIYHLSEKTRITRNILKACICYLIPQTIQIEEGVLTLDQRNDMAISGMLTVGSFDPFQMDIFRKAVREGMNVVDVGSHIGYYTVVAAKRVGPKGKVFAFEPAPENFSFLKKNIQINGLTNVYTENKAVSDSSGSRDFFIEKDNNGHHSFALYKKSLTKTTVESTTLDESLKRSGSPIIDILKIDIEGAEPIALRGMKEMISRSPRMVIFTEVYPQLMKECGESALAYLDELKNLGFSLSIIDEDNKVLVPIKDNKKFMEEAFPTEISWQNIYAVKDQPK